MNGFVWQPQLAGCIRNALFMLCFSANYAAKVQLSFFMCFYCCLLLFFAVSLLTNFLLYCSLVEIGFFVACALQLVFYLHCPTTTQPAIPLSTQEALCRQVRGTVRGAFLVCQFLWYSQSSICAKHTWTVSLQLSVFFVFNFFYSPFWAFTLSMFRGLGQDHSCCH